MYLESNWSWGGDDFGYVSGRETRILSEMSSWGEGRLEFIILFVWWNLKAECSLQNHFITYCSIVLNGRFLPVRYRWMPKADRVVSVDRL
jgi:hypothetical protein